MAWQPAWYSLVAFGAAALSFVVAISAYRHRSNPEALSLVALMCALGGWSFSYAVQLGFTTLPEQQLWQGVGLVIGGLIPPLWFLFALEYAGESNWLGRGGQILLAIDPVVFAGLTFTNPLHGLVWDQAAFVPAVTPRVVLVSLGVAYYVHIVYAYMLVAGGLGLLFLIVSRTSSFYRKQASIMIFAALPPVIANLAFTLRVRWGPLPALDLTPFAFVASGVLVSLALFRFDLLERSPVARQQILDEMGDGFVVLDTDGGVVDSNPIAREITDSLALVREGDGSAAPAAPMRLNTVLDAVHGETVTATVGGRQRAYDVQRSPLTDHRDRFVGIVVAFRDVTGRDEHEQRLDVTQRILRHNLRNKMNVVRGWAELLDETADHEGSEAPRQIMDAADELIDLAEKTRQMVALGEHESTELTPVDLRKCLAVVLDGLRSDYPQATIECSVPAGVTLRLPDEEVLSVAVENLVENAIEHNDAAEPWVEISAANTAEETRINVADDGPGIPETERVVLEAGVETPLAHGSGVGLWLTYWCVSHMGGEITFDSREPRGSIVTMTLPAGDVVTTDE